MTRLEFRLVAAYGHDRYYPVNVAARTIVDITGRKCLKPVEVERLRHSGFDLIIKLEEPSEAAESEGT